MAENRADESPLQLRVVTYNIRKGKGIRGSRPDFETIANHLGDLQPDLLLCQEVFHAGSGMHQSREMATHLDLLHRYEPNAEYRKGHHGNATFSRIHIEHHENRDISPNRIERRGILYTRLETPSANIHVFNTHFALAQRQRLRQANRLAEMIDELTSPADPVILAGDFNDWTGRVDPIICEAADLDNAMMLLTMKERRTWSTRRPLWALDRIYYRNLNLVDIHVLRDAPWDRLSDHFPVVATFAPALAVI
jgi:endonuclease/exonuclease/phosphatase family metal-dependent hydrolase